MSAINRCSNTSTFGDDFQIDSLNYLFKQVEIHSEPQKQKELLERALPTLEKHYGKDHVQVARILENLGSAYGALGDPQKQKKLLERVLPIFENHYGKGHVEVMKILVNLENAYWSLGDLHKANEFLERALPILEKQYIKDHFKNKYGNEPLDFSDLGGQLEVDKYLNDVGEIRLHTAARWGHMRVIKYLTETAEAPLHKAARWGHLQLVEYLTEMVKVDVNVKDELEETPLDKAIRWGHSHVVKYLKKKAEANLEGKNKPVSSSDTRGGSLSSNHEGTDNALSQQNEFPVMFKKRDLKSIDEMEPEEEMHPSSSNFLKLKGSKKSPDLVLERRAKESNVKTPLRIENQFEPTESMRSSMEYRQGLNETIPFIQWLAHMLGRGSFVKRMQQAERVSDQKDLPEKLYWAKKYLDDGMREHLNR